MKLCHALFLVISKLKTTVGIDTVTMSIQYLVSCNKNIYCLLLLYIYIFIYIVFPHSGFSDFYWNFLCNLYRSCSSQLSADAKQWNGDVHQGLAEKCKRPRWGQTEKNDNDGCGQYGHAIWWLIIKQIVDIMTLFWWSVSCWVWC